MVVTEPILVSLWTGVIGAGDIQVRYQEELPETPGLWEIKEMENLFLETYKRKTLKCFLWSS